MPCPSLGLGMLMRRTRAGGAGRQPEVPQVFFLPDSTLPPLASQSFASLAMVKLWPLQPPLPLQSFVPSQWTPFAAWPLPAKATAGAINVASAPAIATPLNVPFLIGSLLGLRDLLSVPPPRATLGRKFAHLDRRRRTFAASFCYARECYPVSRNCSSHSQRIDAKRKRPSRTLWCCRYSAQHESFAGSLKREIARARGGWSAGRHAANRGSRGKTRLHRGETAARHQSGVDGARSAGTICRRGPCTHRDAMRLRGPSSSAHRDRDLPATRAPPAHQTASQRIRSLPPHPNFLVPACPYFPAVGPQCQPRIRRGIPPVPVRDQGVAGSNPVSPTNHLGEIAKEIPAASLAAARHWGFWTLVGPNFVRARTNSQTVLPLAASEGARQVLALGAKVRPGPGPSASSSRSAISPRRLSASAALADALSRPADQWTAGPGDREFFRSTRV